MIEFAIWILITRIKCMCAVKMNNAFAETKTFKLTMSHRMWKRNCASQLLSSEEESVLWVECHISNLLCCLREQWGRMVAFLLRAAGFATRNDNTPWKIHRFLQHWILIAGLCSLRIYLCHWIYIRTFWFIHICNKMF